MTAILVLHGRGERIPSGLAHNFAENLRIVLQKHDIKDCEVIELGLSSDPKKDYKWTSYRSLDFQLKKLIKYINENVLDKLKEVQRIHLIGCSQGSLLLRGLLWSECLDPVADRLDTMVTLGSPNNGIFGLPTSWSFDSNVLKSWYQIMEDKFKRKPWSYDWFLYTSAASKHLSFCSYWNSPDNRHRTKTFLAKINNETADQPKPYLSDKLRALVCVSFELESVVFPNISTTFGFWDRTTTQLVPYNETEYYRKDSFGLRTLDERKALKFETIANQRHMCVPFEFIDETLVNYLK